MAGIYIHIPFCKSRCFYCAFYSSTYGKKIQEDFVEALCNELTIRHDYLNEDKISTIYLGGGTPSQLSSCLLHKIYKKLFTSYSIEKDAEITLEVNPDDITPEFLQQLKSMPINRLSMGIQSFNDNCLRLINRRHTSQEAQNAVKRCQDAGFSNISIDLIYGLPQQTMDLWDKDLQIAFNLHPAHLSSYALSYEKGTILWQQLQDHKLKETDEEIMREMYFKLLRKAKKNGFEHYEISSFALPGYYSRHNSSYWNDTPYMGCGPAAHSYDKKNRRWNNADLKQYIQFKGNTNLPKLSELEILSTAEHYNDYVMTRLRTMKGVSLDAIERIFGVTYLNYLKKNAHSHLHLKNLILEQNNNYLHLTDNGIFVSNDVISDLMYV